ADGKRVARAPIELEEFPEELNVVAPEDLKPQVVMRRSRVSGDGSLNFEGFAFIENLDADLDVTASLRPADAESAGEEPLRFAVAVTSAEVDEADVVSRHPFIDYSSSARRLSVTGDVIDQIARVSEATQSDEWVLELSLATPGGATWETSEVKRTLDLSAGAPLPSRLTAQGHRAVVTGGH